MKKLYYCDEYIERPIISQKDDSDNERRKQLSIETNRRRREMALKVKREIEKEEKRRNDILRQRRDYQNSLNNKLHKRCAQRNAKMMSVQPLTVPDFDRTLTALRRTTPFSSLKQRAQSSEDVTRYRPESAWTDRREVCASPMLKYSGQEGNNKLRDNGHFLKTFETKLMEQEEAFRTKQNLEMNLFSRILDETVFQDVHSQGMQSVVDREGETYRVNAKDDRDEVVECLDDDGDIEDSLNVSTGDCDERGTSELLSDPRQTVQQQEKKKNDHEDRRRLLQPAATVLCKERSDSSRSQLPQTSVCQRMQPISTVTLEQDTEPTVPRRPPLEPCILQRPQSQPITVDQDSSPQSHPCSTIKSILKKAVNNNCGSNPDIANCARAADIRDSVEITKSRSTRLFRSSSFSQGLDHQHDATAIPNKDTGEEDSSRKYVRFADDSASSPAGCVIQVPRSASGPELDRACAADQKTHRTFTVPGSTPLKPPLHPRTTQEGSYLQTTLKKTPSYQPPPRPPKISVESLDKQLEPLIHPKRATNADRMEREKSEDKLWDIAVDKTPTEKEIEQLWAEVRECLSKSRTTYKPESVGPISGRTIDSGSNASVMSAPVWQRSTQRITPFQVRHHRPWPSKEIAYQGQELPIRDEITVHSHVDDTPTTVTQKPLNVISQRDRGFQAVSESLEEFLSLEGSCGPSTIRRFQPTSSPVTGAAFRPRPPSNTRIRANMVREPGETPKGGACSPMRDTTTIAKTQMSLDEDRVKRSLDRLNDRLKNMSTLV